MLKSRSLYARLAVALLGLLVVVGAVHIGLTLWTTEMYQRELEQKLNRHLARDLVAETTLLEDGEIRHDNLEHIFHMLMVINPRIEVYLLDPAGEVLAFSAPEGRVKLRRVAVEPIRAFLAAEQSYPVLGEDPRHPGRGKIFSAAPVPPEGPVQGYLYVVLGGEEYDSVARRLGGSYILRLSAWTGLAAVGLALICGLLVFRLLTRRLVRLDERMRSFQQEGFVLSPPADLDSGASPGADEIGRLEATFRQMAERIATQMEELSQADQMRRELVANVSHDLRTPLAAQRGYLETLLLKDETLTSAQRREYAEIALRHSEQLGKLVGDLFELATLQADEARVEHEPFSIAELAQDVVQKFRLQAGRQTVDLDLALPERLPFVVGDIRLMERVLENLLQNALRHTPERGSVTVSLKEDGGAVHVQIADTGSGISPDELPHIFERFYRGKRSHDSGGGAGLGLAIAERIVELHGSQIRVKSVVDRGSTFSFRLSPATH